jgi:glycosyltransferase involved in cell wall biosynthesis
MMFFPGNNTPPLGISAFRAAVMSRKVLFVSYHFPPDAAVGALRTQKFAKYLPVHGWEPFVLTVREQYYPSLDRERLKDLGEVIVERTQFWRTPLQLLIDVREAFRARKATAATPEDAGRQRNLDRDRGNVGLKRWLVSLNWFPDDKLYWLMPGLVRGLYLVRRNRIPLIVVSAPPNSSILLAFLLSRLTGTKMIIDFRDPWLLGHEQAQQTFKPRRLLDIEKALLVRMLRRAACVITTNDFFRSALLREHSFLDPEQVHVVHNGFDSSDFSTVSCAPPGKTFSIAYVGTFYLQRNPQNFLRAVSLFMRDRSLASHDVEVRFVGDTENASGSSVRAMIEQNGLEDVVNISGKVCYTRALEIMCESSVLLLLAPNQPFQIPAKTYEYMAAGRPILALAQPGATASLIGSMGCGLAVDPDDIEGIRKALHLLYDDHLNRARTYVCDAGVFERRNQASRLANILGRIDA